MQNIKLITDLIGYSFKDQNLLIKAITHPSVNKGFKDNTFERLEFLGDRVLGVVISEYLYRRFLDEEEGDLAKRLSVLVSRETCHQIATEFGLAKFIVVDKTVPKEKKFSTFANATEAVIGAIYLDGGLKQANKFILRMWHEKLEKSISPPTNPKTVLQEHLQKNNFPLPEYKIINCVGPDHNPEFTVEIFVPGFGPYTGVGNNRKTAEQNAALNMINSII